MWKLDHFHHVWPCPTMFRHVILYPDNAWPCYTMSNNLWPSPTMFVHVLQCPDMSDHVRDHTNIVTYCFLTYAYNTLQGSAIECEKPLQNLSLFCLWLKVYWERVGMKKTLFSTLELLTDCNVLACQVHSALNLRSLASIIKSTILYGSSLEHLNLQLWSCHSLL